VQELDKTQKKDLLVGLYRELNTVISEIEDKNTYEQEAITQIKEQISATKREQLFAELKKAVETKRPKNCKSVIEQIEQFELVEADIKIFEEIKKLITKYKFKEVLELL